jgi:hypothetical protein
MENGTPQSQTTVDSAANELLPTRWKDLVLGGLVSMLLISMVGTLLGFAAYPAMMAVFQRANSALGVLGFLVNAVTAVIVFWCLSFALRRHDAVPSGTGRVCNRQILQMAKIATLLLVVQLTYGFIAGEARNFVVVQVGNRAQLDLLTTSWAIVLRFVIPGVFLVLLLVLTQEPAESFEGPAA